MNSTLDFYFKHDVKTVFEHMVHYKNFENWNPIEGLHSVVNLENDGAYSGFSTQFDIGGELATIECQSLLYSENKEVRYKISRSVFKDGTEITKGWSFPYTQMYQRLCFIGDDNQCNVKHEIILKPKNWLGWLTCRLCVMPQVKSVLRKSNQALDEYLQRL